MNGPRDNEGGLGTGTGMGRYASFSRGITCRVRTGRTRNLWEQPLAGGWRPGARTPHALRYRVQDVAPPCRDTSRTQGNHQTNRKAQRCGQRVRRRNSVRSGGLRARQLSRTTPGAFACSGEQGSPARRQGDHDTLEHSGAGRARQAPGCPRHVPGATAGLRKSLRQRALGADGARGGVAAPAARPGGCLAGGAWAPSAWGVGRLCPLLACHARALDTCGLVVYHGRITSMSCGHRPSRSAKAPSVSGPSCRALGHPAADIVPPA
jgi:hypothetical protein